MVSLADKHAVLLTNAGIEWSRLSASAQRLMTQHLGALEVELVAKLYEFDIAGVSNLAVKRARTETLLRQVRGIIDDRYEGFAKIHTRNMTAYAHEVTDEIGVLLNAPLKVNLFHVGFTASDLRVLGKDTLVMGRPAEEWWAKQSENLYGRYSAQVRMGYLSGESNEDIVRRIRGKDTGRKRTVRFKDGTTRRIRQFEGGVMTASTREAHALVRTSTNAISNSALMDSYRQNDDVIEGVAALTTLDGRTTDICMARTGGAWNMETGEPLPEDASGESFPGDPPWHMNCRTFLTPITKTWDQLADQFPEHSQQFRALQEMPASTRATMDGQMSGIKTFDDYLKKQDKLRPGFARKKLGPGRFDLWKKGKITTRQLTDQTGRPRTLRELKGLDRPKVAPRAPKPPRVAPTPPTPAPRTVPRPAKPTPALEALRRKVAARQGLTPQPAVFKPEAVVGEWNLPGLSKPKMDIVTHAITTMLRRYGSKVGKVGYSTRKGTNLGKAILYADGTTEIELRKSFLANPKKYAKQAAVRGNANRAASIARKEEFIRYMREEITAGKIKGDPVQLRAMIAQQEAQVASWKATNRFAAYQTADDALASAAHHEAAHVVMFTRDLEERFMAALNKYRVTLVDKGRISEYATVNHRELWAESLTAIQQGDELPERLAAAIRETLGD